MSFQRFNRADDIVENQRTTITSGLWTGGGTQLTTFFTASAFLTEAPPNLKTFIIQTSIYR